MATVHWKDSVPASPVGEWPAGTEVGLESPPPQEWIKVMWLCLPCALLLSLICTNFEKRFQDDIENMAIDFFFFLSGTATKCRVMTMVMEHWTEPGDAVWGCLDSQSIQQSPFWALSCSPVITRAVLSRWFQRLMSEMRHWNMAIFKSPPTEDRKTGDQWLFSGCGPFILSFLLASVNTFRYSRKLKDRSTNPNVASINIQPFAIMSVLSVFLWL